MGDHDSYSDRLNVQSDTLTALIEVSGFADLGDFQKAHRHSIFSAPNVNGLNMIVGDLDWHLKASCPFQNLEGRERGIGTGCQLQILPPCRSLSSAKLGNSKTSASYNYVN
jgi:hypothetical protein